MKPETNIDFLFPINHIPLGQGAELQAPSPYYRKVEEPHLKWQSSSFPLGGATNTTICFHWARNKQIYHDKEIGKSKHSNILGSIAHRILYSRPKLPIWIKLGNRR